MNLTTKRSLPMAAAAIIGVTALFANDQAPQLRIGSFMSQAKAVIGRPLTPLSYAGVARRTTRRAYGAAAVYGAPVVAAPVIVTGCVQAVDAYGRIYTRCP
jgi:hypothetical protein